MLSEYMFLYCIVLRCILQNVKYMKNTNNTTVNTLRATWICPTNFSSRLAGAAPSGLTLHIGTWGVVLWGLRGQRRFAPNGDLGML